MKQQPLLIRFTDAERRVVQHAVRHGTDPRVSESAFVKGATLMFALAMTDKRGVEIITELANSLMRKHRAESALTDAIKLFGTA